MRRSSFLLAGAGAALAGCANDGLPPNATALDAPSQQQRYAHFEQGMPMIGSLLLVPYDFIVRQYAACDGAAIPIASNHVLFSLLSTRFGGNGVWNFRLTDLRGKAPIDGLSYQIAIQGRFPAREQAVRANFGIAPLLGQLLLMPHVPARPVPAGWDVCDGAVLNASDHPALFSLVGHKFGGDGRTTFALPDLRDRVPHKDLRYLIALEGRFPAVA